MDGISKNQIKKAAKRERIAEKYRLMKEAKKNSRSECTREASAVVSAIRQERNAMCKADYDSKSLGGATIVIDCDWRKKMTDKELFSLTQQIMYSYAANKRAAKPARICITGVSPEHETLIRKMPGFQNWGIHLTRKTLYQLSLPTAIYLSADTETCLDANAIDNNSILVIGGLVDRNRYKNATMVRAEELGFGTAQLPIGEFMPLKSSRVLTVNHVVEILLEVTDHQDWKRALDTVIPDRKKTIDP